VSGGSPGKSGSGRAARGGRTKSGKPRPGTGGYGKRRLEGKGPTPPAHLRPGHPAQRRAAAAARDPGGTDPEGRGTPAGRSAGRSSAGQAGRVAAGRSARTSPAGDSAGGRARGAGDAAEVVAGRNAVLEALRAAVPATALYAGPRAGADDRVREAIALAAQARLPMIEAGGPELDRLTGGSVHQGLALRIAPYDYAHPDDLVARAAARDEPPLIVALDGVTDPRNLGAIARVPVAQAPNLARALTSYAEQGLFVVGLDAAGTVGVDGLELADGPLVLVIGSEGRGLSRLVAQRCDLLAQIPMAAATESLNAGVAAGIALHEVARRRGLA
jgi:23S rRNA (guanosine2251-2'-O)-methyltransferase